MISRPANFLRNVLLVDAATCVASGILMTLGSGPIASLTAIPPALLLYAGLSLIPVAAFMTMTATRPVISRLAVWLIIDGNVLWVAGSLWLMVGSPIAPTAISYAFIGVQALAVAILAAFRIRRPAPAFARTVEHGDLIDVHGPLVVIAAERRQAREPGPKNPCLAVFLMPGCLGPGSAPPGSSPGASGMTVRTA